MLLFDSCLTGISLPCKPGYVCIGGSDIPEPADDIIGYICPVGHFCREAAYTHEACVPGTYAPIQGLGRFHANQ